jgi:very-short-patch-repair endonuclease
MTQRSKPTIALNRGELLVAIMNTPSDFEILKTQGWYRIPVDTAPKRWPPQWIAFYQTKVFGDEAHAVRYYGRVARINRAPRHVLFPEEPENPKSGRLYYQVHISSLEERYHPIISRRWRRIVFIPTTWSKFTEAEEINDLFDDSPLEDTLWRHLRRERISAERQWEWQHRQSRYVLDFAVFCHEGSLDIETDGDSYHANPDASVSDNERNNALAAAGWHVLRFNSLQINERAADYCLPNVLETINKLGGPKEDTIAARKFYSLPEGTAQQLALLESTSDYDLE